MSLTASDISNARMTAKIGQIDFCKAAKLIIPVLEKLAENTSGWKFWLKWGINALIAALKAYTNNYCITIPASNPDV